MKLLTKEITKKLIANFRTDDAVPVVKFFTPDANCTWLITEIDPEDMNTMFGLCDLGFGTPEMGYVTLEEIKAVRGPMGLAIERDKWFTGEKTLTEYWTEAVERRGKLISTARAAGRIAAERSFRT